MLHKARPPSVIETTHGQVDAQLDSKLAQLGNALRDLGRHEGPRRPGQLQVDGVAGVVAEDPQHVARPMLRCLSLPACFGA